VTLAPLIAAPMLVQVHAALGLAALVVGAARVMWPHREGWDRALGWGFLGLLLAVAGSALLLARPPGTPNLSGLTLGHLFVLASLLGAIAALRTAGGRHRLLWRNIVTCLFAGVLIMAGLFEVMPGRLLYTVLAGG
jgi:uncharacterized membrane protein